MEEITIHRLTAARVFAVRSMPGHAVIEIASGDEEIHFSLTVQGLADLAERFRQDALLLQA